MNLARFLFLAAICATVLQSPATGSATPASLPAGKAQLSVVRVNSTDQPYDFIRPWSKKSAFVRHGLGAVLPGNRVLVTAELVANHNYVDFEKAESGEKVAAKVLCVDYESNLALLAPADETGTFLGNLKPLEVATDAVVGDVLHVLQLESNDALVSTAGPVTTAEVGRYQLEGAYFLLYRLSLPLQYREGSFTAPVIDKAGKLAGVLMRFDSRGQVLDVIPGPIIEHFLKDVGDHPDAYHGFPSAGLEYCATRDPQLRRYADLPPDTAGGGIYVTSVEDGSAAEAAGLKQGDVILDVDGQPIDQDGNYEEPLYGKISLSYLFSTKSYVGQKMPLKISRGGQTQVLEITLSRRPPLAYVSPPYVIDKPPRFLIAEGLIFQELSRQYLKEWGSDWQKQAPQRLVYLDRYQSEVIKDQRKRVVVLSQVLPAASNIGYEDLAYLVVKSINGKELNSLDDLASALSETPASGFYKVEFEDFPREIYLDAAQLKADNLNIQQAYGLPVLQQME